MKRPWFWVQESLETLGRALGEASPYYAWAYLDYVDILKVLGRYEEAALHLERARETYAEPFRDQFWWKSTWTQGAASLAMKRGHLAEAESLWATAREMFGEENPDTEVAIEWIRTNQAEIREVRAEYEAALEMVERSLGVVSRRYGSEHPRTAFLLLDVARLQRRTGKAREALDKIERALAIWKQHEAETFSGGGRALAEKARCLAACQQHEEVEALYTRATEVLLALGPAKAVPAAETLRSLAVWYEERGRRAEAVTCLRQAQAVLEDVSFEQHWETGRIKSLLGFLLPQGNTEREGLLREGSQVLERHLGEEHPWSLEARRRIGG